MGRLPPPDRDALPPEDQAVWDRIAAVRRGVRGPFGVLMHVPELADRVRALEDYFRFDSELLGADRELVILVTAREWRRATPGHDMSTARTRKELDWRRSLPCVRTPRWMR